MRVGQVHSTGWLAQKDSSAMMVAESYKYMVSKLKFKKNNIVQFFDGSPLSKMFAQSSKQDSSINRFC